jgi:hypothetical protein
MKIKLSAFLVLAASLAFISSCKKSSSATADPQLTPQQVASQVALSLGQNLTGGYGGFDVTAGLNPSNQALHTKSKKINDLSDGDLCGLTVDTTSNSDTTVNGTRITVKGTIGFSFICTIVAGNNVVSGFTTTDNLSAAISTSELSTAEKIVESLTVTSLSPGDDTADISIKGSLTSSGSYQFKTGTKRSGTEVFNYTLNNILIDPNQAIITSGTVTFSTSGSGPKGVWSYSGSVTFLGGDKSTVTINGKTYNVSLSTGVVS